ncbi:hypothetical protein L5515_010845 [Caenorhabditis briggsae]|uniref:Uncharacterized protein n=1 Tax=Caenorhabditis briggsae TaxID=6238 RepID=A0AAE9ESG1_CAEBR|nr:hypothetical protein L5515_010845 [Caenorhabditis briggsae]
MFQELLGWVLGLDFRIQDVEDFNNDNKDLQGLRFWDTKARASWLLGFRRFEEALDGFKDAGYGTFLC